MQEPADHHGDHEKTGGAYSNETIRLLIERASCRSFSEKKIPEDVMLQVLRSGVHAATGGNLQPYSIIRIEEQATKEKLAHLNEDQMFIATAPVNLLFCIDWHRTERWARLEAAPFTAAESFRHFWISFQDTIIAAQNICTAADALGLGSVYVGTVMECIPQLREICKLPDKVFPVVLLSLGYPKVRPQPRRKLGVPSMVHNETYQDPSDAALLKSFNEKYPESRREITPERLEAIADVCRKTGGEELAETCIARIKQQGFISAVQYYFGLHYRADQMPTGNETFLKTMEEFGFGWFTGN